MSRKMKMPQFANLPPGHLEPKMIRPESTLGVAFVHIVLSSAFFGSYYAARWLFPTGDHPSYVLVLGAVDISAPFLFNHAITFLKLTRTASAAAGDATNKDEGKQTTDAIAGILASSDTAAAATATPVADPIDPTRKGAAMIKATRKTLERPLIAWPTIALAVVATTLWLASFALHATGRLAPAWAFLLSTVATYLAFTPMHDAVHSAIAPRLRSLNDWVGFLVSGPFMFRFSMFKKVHLMHHRYANDQDSAPDGTSLDPDHWAGTGPVWLLPLRWCTVFHWYMSYVLRQQGFEFDREQARGKKGPRKGSWRDPQTALAFFLITVMKGAACYLLGTTYLVCWLAPFMAGSSFLMYVFDYIPHRPHRIPYRSDAFVSTSVTTIFSSRAGSLLDSVLLLSQNLHNIHHIYPYLPFYRYLRVWRAHGGELVDKGTRVLPFFLWPSRAGYLAELQHGGDGDDGKKGR